MVRVADVDCIEHVLQIHKSDIPKKALDVDIIGKRGRSMATWKKKLGALIGEIGLRGEYASTRRKL